MLTAMDWFHLAQEGVYTRRIAELEGIVDDGKRRDQDETRRLLYMALYARRTDRYELVGTLVNALAHHSSGLDPDEVGEHVLAAVDNYRDDHEVHAAWLRTQIARLTSEMESDPTP